MKVTCLGTGSAYGVPTCGGDWGNCDPVNPKNKRLSQSILIEDGKTKVLIDMGPGFREQSCKYDLKNLDAILFTHSHYDHFAGLPELPNFTKYQVKPLFLYAHDDTWAGIVRSIFWMFDPNINIQYYGTVKPKKKTFEYNQSFTIGCLEIMPFLQFHGGMKSTGFRIGDFAYTTDVNSMPEESWKHLAGVKTWILECDSLKKTSDHNNPEQANEWINRIKPERAYITHLDITMDHDESAKLFPSHVQIAYDGLVINS